MKVSVAPKLTVPSMNDTTKPVITIKKYANRRLYNTATSTYVTLETLAGMVKEGVDFCVYDAKTSEDITRSVLTQIIVEEEDKSGQQNLLPISFLRQLIGFYGNNMQWLVPKYLEHSMDMFSNNQDQITNYFQTAFGGMFPFGTTFEEMGKKNLELFERTMRMFTPFAMPTGTASSEDAPQADKEKKETSSSSGSAGACCAAPRASAAPSCCDALASVTTLSRHTDPAPVVSIPVKISVEEVVPPSAPKTETVSKPIACSMDSPATAPAKVHEPKPALAKKEAACAATACSCAAEASSAPPTVSAPVSTPMPNVQQSVMANTTPTADDMQQKIANLQRQLADLAKNRA